jgi:elongation factor G
MKVYSGSGIRNVAIIGHNDTGKTTLVSELLFNAGATTRMGRVEDGTTATDFDPDEIRRKHSISTAVAFAEWKDTKINLLDTPGFGIFIMEAKGAARCGRGCDRRQRCHRRRGHDRESVEVRGGSLCRAR